MQDEAKVHLKDQSGGHKQKTLLCSQCDFKAKFKSCLARHNVRHSGEKPFVCTHNGCTFSSAYAGSLVAHQLVHSNTKPLRCNLCGKCYRTRSHLNCHIRSHTGERPYKCLFSNCEYSSTLSSSLQRHFRTHTGEKPYRCSNEACEYSSVHASNLKRHMMAHEDGKVHTCSFKNCKYSSIHASDFKRHTNRIHIRNKRHVCRLCEYRSVAPFELKRHIKKHEKGLQTSMNRPRLTRPISSNSSSLISIESTKRVSNSKLIKSFEVDEDIEASRDPTRKTKSRPSNSADPVDDPKLQIPTVVVLKRLQVNYDSDDDFIPDISGAQVALSIPTASDYTKINTEPQRPQTGLTPKSQPYLYTCKICDYETQKVNQYKAHLQSHREQRQFFCPLCDFVCFKKRLLKSHLRNHDNDSSGSDSDHYNDTQSHHARVSIASKEAPFSNTSASANTNCFGSQS